MRKLTLGAGVGLAMMCSLAMAELEPWKDYEPSEAVWMVTTVKVDANMGDVYLEGLRDTWVSSSEVAKKLGHIEDYSIMRSDLAASGDFNLLLMVKFKDTAALAPDKAKYEAFVEAYSKKRLDKTTKKAQMEYPGIRTITGSYQMREIKIK